MRSAKLHGIRDLRVHSDAPLPKAGPGEALVRVQAVGVCGSDIHYYTEGRIGTSRIDEPMTPGHEFAGVLSDGTLVAVDPAQPCGECAICLAGYANLCPHVRFIGLPGAPGGLCEAIAVPIENVVPLPDGLNATHGALLEPLGVALHALDITRIKPMSSVAVVGAGPIGLLITQVAWAVGAGHIRVIEPHAGRRHLALKVGADAVHAGWEEALEASQGLGAQFVIEATNSPDGPEHAARVAAVGGHVTLVGIPEGDRFEMNAGNARRKGLTIRMSRRMGNVYPRAIELVRQSKVDLDILVSHRYPLERAGEAFEAAAALAPDFIKAVIEVGN